MRKKRKHPAECQHKYAPDYNTNCIICEQSPTVVVLKLGKIQHASEMCGPCTFGTAEALDPDTWNP